MVVLYVKIFLAIKKRSKEMEKMTGFQSNEMRSGFLYTFLTNVMSGCVEPVVDSLSDEEQNLVVSKRRNYSTNSRYLTLSPGNRRKGEAISPSLSICGI